jgi:tRNA dimethylallyltransferase
MDFLPPTERFSAGDFARRSSEIIDEIVKKGRPVILVGGTGLYLKALVDGLAPLPPRDESVRRDLAARAKKEGRPALHRELTAVDPVASEKIPANNIQRIVRALEVYRLTGKPLSWWHREKTTPSPLSFLWIGLHWEKSALESRLAERCRAMVNGGLVEETASLLKSGVPADAPAFQSLGYREALAHLAGRLTRAEMSDQFIHQTRLYAKRQLTWFRRDPRVEWMTPEQARGVVGGR